MLSFTRPSKMTICIINLVTSERTFNFWERFVLIYIYVYLCLCVCVHVYVYMYIHIHLREEHGSVHALASNQGQVEIPKIEPYILLISQKSALQSFDAANSVLLRVSTRKTRTAACSYCKSTVGFFFFWKFCKVFLRFFSSKGSSTAEMEKSPESEVKYLKSQIQAIWFEKSELIQILKSQHFIC